MQKVCRLQWLAASCWKQWAKVLTNSNFGDSHNKTNKKPRSSTDVGQPAGTVLAFFSKEERVLGSTYLSVCKTQNNAYISVRQNLRQACSLLLLLVTWREGKTWAKMVADEMHLCVPLVATSSTCWTCAYYPTWNMDEHILLIFKCAEIKENGLVGKA